MGSLPITDWQAALDRMEASLTAATKALDRAEERWELAVAPSAGDGEPPSAFDRLEASLGEWESRLRAASELTDSLTLELAERTAAVEQWRTLFARWEESLQREGSTS